MLDLGKVVGVHRESQKVDLIMLSNDRPLSGVKVMSGMASGDAGYSDIPVPDVNNAANPFHSTNTGGRDMFAVVAFFSGAGPIVIGFLFPETAQCLFPDANRMIYRHASDAYFTIDGAANTEFAHPSGLYLRVGASPAHEDLTGRDYNGRFKVTRNTSPNVHFHLQMGGNTMSLDVDPSGNVALSSSGTVTVNAQGATTVSSAAAVNIQGAAGVNISSTNGTPANITSQGPVSITSQGAVSVKATTINLN
ncbi:hypothetical protein [Burkholderia sp. Ac-20349]|uniref:hypothetical protein n=1 Tax=Burkholderia sp. Ac-20349 TaxID=2703893 RepID=UPI00197C3635|nr:hypothetical protein [Burkholderia sp. Ac-20349]MBN3839270.1 hypothetical protein [Burkholderia sp. Ac-20349]